MSPEQLSLPLTLLLFGGGALVIAVAGSRLAAIANRLSDLTGLGEAVFGAVLLGTTTSLPGSVVSITTALAGRADLAVGNAVGRIGAQTLSYPHNFSFEIEFMTSRPSLGPCLIRTS